MKKILITGANSYIGTSFEKWVSQWPEEYSVDTVDMVDGSWKEKDFSGYDTVFHVAGIAHVKETKRNAHLYYQVNRDIAIESAKKAKSEGVTQFVLLSTMSVYGMETGVISKDTLPHPKSNYGKSKLQAEAKINELTDDNFGVATLRPPMVYGKGCKGNYRTLSKIAVRFPIFPNITNERSMVYIDNLNEFIRQCINGRDRGLFFPQNENYIRTCEMIRLIAETHGKKIKLTKMFNPILRIMRLNIVKKVFGSLVYVKEKDRDYQVCGFQESIVYSEK